MKNCCAQDEARRRSSAADDLQAESDRLLTVMADLRTRSLKIRLDALLDESGLTFAIAVRLLTRLRRKRLVHSLPSHSIFLTSSGLDRARALS